MTAAQLREARRLLGWSAFKLARLCGIPETVVKKFEATGHMSQPMFKNELVDRSVAMRAVLEGGGVEFIEQNDGGLSVRLRSSHDR